AGELLRLYAALLDVQERTFLRAIDDRPGPGSLARYVAARVMAGVAEATVAAGPPALAAAVPERLRHGDPAAFVAAWLGGGGPAGGGPGGARREAPAARR